MPLGCLEIQSISSVLGEEALLQRLTVVQTAAAKGLMSGVVTLHRRDGSSIDLRNSSDGYLIPSVDDILSIDMAAIRCVFVIEKEVSWSGVLMTSHNRPAARQHSNRCCLQRSGRLSVGRVS